MTKMWLRVPRLLQRGPILPWSAFAVGAALFAHACGSGSSHTPGPEGGGEGGEAALAGAASTMEDPKGTGGKPTHPSHGDGDAVMGGASSGGASSGGASSGGASSGGAPSDGGAASDGGSPTSGGTSAGGSSGGLPGAACDELPNCDATPPTVTQTSWNHATSALVTAGGNPRHRGHDFYFNPDDPQWIIAKFAYGISDSSLNGEDVEIHVLRDCGSSWEHLTTTGTSEGGGPTVLGIDDDGGRVFFQIPAAQALGLGRHRVRLTVKGDLTATESFLEVVPQGTPVVISDVDGTLTASEPATFQELLGTDPSAAAGAASILTALAAKGARIMYLSNRPEWLMTETRTFLGNASFPRGIVRVTATAAGATDQTEAQFKLAELEALDDMGILVQWAFGNSAWDAAAFEGADVKPTNHRVLVQYTDSAYGARRIDAFDEIAEDVAAWPNLCD